MKRFLTSLVCLLLALHVISQGTDNYQVLRFSSQNIKIDGKMVKEKMIFKSDAKIEWAKDAAIQILQLKNLKSGMLYRYSNKQLQSQKVSSIKDFYLRTSKTSTRDVNDSETQIQVGINKDKFSEKRIALVIGNSDYHSLGYLRNAMTDAARISEELQKLGFDVIEGYECRYEKMRTLLNNFSTLAKNYDVAMIYYSGHGIQWDNVNYMIPIEARLESVGSLNLCVAASDFVEKLDNTGCETKIMVFDACRDIKQSWSRSSNAGLAVMEGTPGMVIAFSTQNGKVASDGDGDCSPFAKSILDNIESDASFSDMMRNVVKQTYVLTNRTQYPVTMGNLMSDFKFNAKGGKLPKVSLSNQKETRITVSNKSAANTSKTTTATPTAPENPKIEGTFNNMNISAKAFPAKMVGNSAVFKIILANKTDHDIKPIFNRVETLSYDNAGGMQKAGDIFLQIGNQKIGWSQSFTLPAGISLSMNVIVSPVSSQATMLSYVSLYFERSEGMGTIHESTLKLKNIPIEK